MEKHNMQYGTIRIGQIVKLFIDGFGWDAIRCSLPNNDATGIYKKRFQRLQEGNLSKTVNDFEQVMDNFLLWLLKHEYIAFS